MRSLSSSLSKMASAIQWNEVKALSFDIYGTLLDWENGIAQTARSTVLGPHLPIDHKQFMLEIEEHDTTVQREHPAMVQSEVIAEGMRRYARDLKVVEQGKLTQDQVEQACKEYSGKITEYPAFPDTVAAMQRLGKYFKLIPLTNIDNKSFAKALEGPLKGITFDAIYTAEDIGSYKPDIRNFRYLLEQVQNDFGVEKDGLCHVAQSLFHDHRKARELEIQNVWVDRNGFMGGSVDRITAQEEFGFKLKVDSLAELADIVEAALSRS